MTHQSPYRYPTTPIDAGRQIAQLRHVLRLVQELGGLAAAAPAEEAALDESARISIAYERAWPVVQRRFDALAEETAAWSAAAVEALLSAGDIRRGAAARRLAIELDEALKGLKTILRL